MVALSIWVGRLWSTLHWLRWPWPVNPHAAPPVQAQADAAHAAVWGVMAQLGSAMLLLQVGAPLLAAISLRWRPRWFGAAVLALCIGWLTVNLAVIP